MFLIHQKESTHRRHSSNQLDYTGFTLFFDSLRRTDSNESFDWEFVSISGCSVHLTITFYYHLKSYNTETQRFSIRSEPLYPIKLWNPLHKSSLDSSQAGDITWFNTPYPIIPCEWSGQWWHYNGYESCHDVCMRNADCKTSFSLCSLFCLFFLSVFSLSLLFFLHVSHHRLVSIFFVSALFLNFSWLREPWLQRLLTYMLIKASLLRWASILSA